MTNIETAGLEQSPANDLGIENKGIETNNIEAKRQRYEDAAKALAGAGGMTFIELVEARDPVAMEYLLALDEYSSAMGSSEVSTESQEVSQG